MDDARTPLRDFTVEISVSGRMVTTVKARSKESAMQTAKDSARHRHGRSVKIDTLNRVGTAHVRSTEKRT